MTGGIALSQNGRLNQQKFCNWDASKCVLKKHTHLVGINAGSVWMQLILILAVILLLMFWNPLFSFSFLVCTSSSIISSFFHVAISFVSYLTRAQLLIHLLMEIDHSQIVVKKAEYASWINISALIFNRLLFSLLLCWGRMFVDAFLNSETMRL